MLVGVGVGVVVAGVVATLVSLEVEDGVTVAVDTVEETSTVVDELTMLVVVLPSCRLATGMYFSSKPRISLELRSVDRELCSPFMSTAC